jgi:hypothetical protein
VDGKILGRGANYLKNIADRILEKNHSKVLLLMNNSGVTDSVHACDRRALA